MASPDNDNDDLVRKYWSNWNKLSCLLHLQFPNQKGTGRVYINENASRKYNMSSAP